MWDEVQPAAGEPELPPGVGEGTEQVFWDKVAQSKREMYKAMLKRCDMALSDLNVFRANITGMIDRLSDVRKTVEKSERPDSELVNSLADDVFQCGMDNRNLTMRMTYLVAYFYHLATVWDVAHTIRETVREACRKAGKR